jgi:hypothetical protein
MGVIKSGMSARKRDGIGTLGRKPSGCRLTHGEAALQLALRGVEGGTRRAEVPTGADPITIPLLITPRFYSPVCAEGAARPSRAMLTPYLSADGVRVCCG